MTKLKENENVKIEVKTNGKVPGHIFKSFKYYSIKDLAEILEASTWTVQTLCRKGIFNPVKIGGRYFISDADLTRYLNQPITGIQGSMMLKFIKNTIKESIREELKKVKS